MINWKAELKCFSNRQVMVMSSRQMDQHKQMTVFHKWHGWHEESEDGCDQQNAGDVVLEMQKLVGTAPWSTVWRKHMWSAVACESRDMYVCVCYEIRTSIFRLSGVHILLSHKTADHIFLSYDQWEYSIWSMKTHSPYIDNIRYVVVVVVEVVVVVVVKIRYNAKD